MRTTRTRTGSRTLAALALLAATGLFLTACDSGSGSDSAADGSGSGAGSTASADADSGPDADADSDADSDAGAGSDDEADTNAAAGSGTENGPVDNPDAPGADGTFSGVLTFLAPGKLLVGERAFWVAVDTETTGGDICGDPETPEAEKCTPDELDAAAKSGNLNVEVTIKKGTAERVRQSS